jgi:hypothetical protein
MILESVIIIIYSLALMLIFMYALAQLNLLFNYLAAQKKSQNCKTFNLDNPEEVKKFAKEKMSKKVSPDEGGSLARTRETDSMAKTVQQSSAVEAYGSSVASQELAKEAMQAEDNNTDVATSSETLRDNTKMLTAMTIQSIKILGQIRTMEALKSEVGSVDTIRTSKEVDEEALANSKGNEKGSW